MRFKLMAGWLTRWLKKRKYIKVTFGFMCVRVCARVFVVKSKKYKSENLWMMCVSKGVCD